VFFPELCSQSGQFLFAVRSCPDAEKLLKFDRLAINGSDLIVKIDEYWTVITTFDVLLNICSFNPGNESRSNKYVV